MSHLKLISSGFDIGNVFPNNERGHHEDDHEGDIPPWAYLHHQDAYPPTPETPQSDVQSEMDLPQPPVDPDEEPLVAVLGVGYVGSHLVSAFSSRYSVVGFDVSETQIEKLREQYRDSKTVELTTDTRDIMRATHFLISVPTLLRPDKSVDSSYLRSALETVGKVGRPGSTVVIESSVAVGMTRQLLGPLAQAKGFYAGMSPERVDPGRTSPPVMSIPKIISALDDVTPGSLSRIQALYSPVFSSVHPVSSPEAAEMVKLYENCQRMVCIAYANEMADACIPHGLDPYEVCAAAATKPFGYMPYYPGAGVGGHCIPVNPYYLLSNGAFPLLEQATSTMWQRPMAVAERALDSLAHRGIRETGRSPKVLVVGVAFKVGQSSLSNSPGLEIAKKLVVSQKVEVTWADTLVQQEAIPQIPRLADDDWRSGVLKTFDLIIVVLRQHGMDLDLLSGLEDTEVDWWCKRA